MYRRNPTDVIGLLKQLLSNTYLLYIQTQGAHWNIVGNDFPQLHTLFQTQYGELVLAVDLIAEHIRTYQAAAPGSATEFLRDAAFQDLDYTHAARLDAQALITQLVAGHRACAGIATQLGNITAQELHTQNLAADRIAAHNKAIWMLESTLGNAPAMPAAPMMASAPTAPTVMPMRRYRNPWGVKDVARFNKRCAGRAACRSKWPRVANAVLRRSGDKGRAVRIANWQTKRMGLKRRSSRSNPYKKSSKKRARRNPKKHCAAKTLKGTRCKSPARSKYCGRHGRARHR